MLMLRWGTWTGSWWRQETGEAAKGPGPFVEQAKQALAGIRGAQ